MSEARFLKVSEVAEQLRLGESTIYKALDEGRMPGYRVLGQWRVDAGQLAQWLESNTIKPRTRKQSSAAEYLAEVREIRSGLNKSA